MKKLLETVNWWASNYRAVIASKTQSKGTPSQAQVAQESFEFWKTRTTNLNAVFALLGNEEGETSFILGVVGDKKTGGAHSIFQWHKARIDDMKKGCGIDVATCNHLDALKAAHWEMTESSSYKKVWPSLIGCATIQDAVAVLVHDYERSGSQKKDVEKRIAFAEKWKQRFTKKSKKPVQEKNNKKMVIT